MNCDVARLVDPFFNSNNWLGALPMKSRKLRIVWSVVWGVAAVLVGVMWVRSYFYLDRISRGGTGLVSMNGRLVTREVFNLNGEVMKAGKKVSTYNFGSVSIWTAPIGLLTPVNLGKKRPYWPWPAAAIAIGSVVWIPYRFSLRMLLIAMTLVAVGLGFYVWLR